MTPNAEHRLRGPALDLATGEAAGALPARPPVVTTRGRGGVMTFRVLRGSDPLFHREDLHPSKESKSDRQGLGSENAGHVPRQTLYDGGDRDARADRAGESDGLRAGVRAPDGSPVSGGQEDLLPDVQRPPGNTRSSSSPHRVTAPGKPVDLALLEKVRAIRARVSETAE